MTRRTDSLEELQREVERLFHDLVYQRHPASHFSEPSWSPSADLVVTPTGARILFELAGVPREGVRLTIRGRVVEVNGRRVPPKEMRVAHYHRAEIFFGNFHRAVELPWEADQDQVEARFRDGMLEVQLVPVRTPLPADIVVERK